MVGLGGENCEDYFDQTTWTEKFNADDLKVKIKVNVFEPAAIAGTYDVALERKTKATATRTKQTT